MKITRNQLNFKGVKEFGGCLTRNDELINKEIKLLKELIEFNILKESMKTNHNPYLML